MLKIDLGNVNSTDIIKIKKIDFFKTLFDEKNLANMMKS